LNTSSFQNLESPRGEAGRLRLRHPLGADGAALHALVSRCSPLDLNSVYAYFLVCDHFASTSVLAEDEQGEVVGAITAYRKPEEPEVLFVWQVAVNTAGRGRGLATSMLEFILRSRRNHSVRFLETTITPSNQASWKLFRGMARQLGASCRERRYLDAECFGEDGHESEEQLSIGPFEIRPRESEV
jgi:L-2,4-diaminobutyric acid acetyltransferase